MPCTYICSSCGREFEDSDATDFPIICRTCKVLAEFSEKIKKESKDLPPEFSKLIDKHFWELI